MRRSRKWEYPEIVEWDENDATADFRQIPGVDIFGNVGCFPHNFCFPQKEGCPPRQFGLCFPQYAECVPRQSCMPGQSGLPGEFSCFPLEPRFEKNKRVRGRRRNKR